MNNITITVPDDKFTLLQEKASRLGISPNDLMLLILEEIVARPDEEFQQAAKYVLQKNAELFRRLA